MAFLNFSKFALIVSVISVSACSTSGVVNGVVDTTGYVTKAAVNGTIGAGKMVVRGVSGSDSK
ncbi:hypothetical protein [Loktanella salsilacus]|uniref:hypothetical protein n=1 Tax=Loktanella salsilacus TaxID=195913 RepID=UPI0037359B0C